MTCIISSNIKTKKQLRETLASAPGRVGIDDPSIFPGAWSGLASEMATGQRVVVTNHPKRSWFAQIERTATGFKVS